MREKPRRKGAVSISGAAKGHCAEEPSRIHFDTEFNEITHDFRMRATTLNGSLYIIHQILTDTPMRTKTHARAITLAGTALKPRRGRTFTSGLLYGLGAAGLFLAGELPRPKAPKEGLRSDWKAVGRDLDLAMKRYGE